MGKVAWQLSLELRKVSGDHGDVESGKNRLLGLAIEQETECGVKPTLWRIPPRNHSFVCLFAHRYMMTALATCFADHHFEFEWIAVADLVDLDHSGLRHYRFVCRASCRLDRRTTLPRQVESGSPSVVPPALHHRVMSGSRLRAISKSQATRAAKAQSRCRSSMSCMLDNHTDCVTHSWQREPKCQIRAELYRLVWWARFLPLTFSNTRRPTISFACLE